MASRFTLRRRVAFSETGLAGIIEALPVNVNTASAHADFAGGWVRSDPDAAARWVASQPENLYAAQGLAESWAGFDDTAASEWAAALPRGKLRDGAARGLVNAIAPFEPEAALRWAADISIPWQAAQAYCDLAGWWGNKGSNELSSTSKRAPKFRLFQRPDEASRHLSRMVFTENIIAAVAASGSGIGFDGVDAGPWVAVHNQTGMTPFGFDFIIVRLTAAHFGDPRAPSAGKERNILCKAALLVSNHRA